MNRFYVMQEVIETALRLLAADDAYPEVGMGLPLYLAVEKALTVVATKSRVWATIFGHPAPDFPVFRPFEMEGMKNAVRCKRGGS